MLTTRVGVIGGGPGGLMTAYLLEQRIPSCAVTLFEAAPRLGGKIVTREFRTAHVPYEAGAAELYDYSQLGQDPLRELVEALGLTTHPISGGTLVLDGRILKTSEDIQRELGAASSRALRQFNRKAREVISPAEYYDTDWREDNQDPLSQESFRSLLSEVPDPAARRYIEVAVHSDLATEPEHTSAAYGLQNYLMDEPDYMRMYTIDGGIERLPRELAKRLAARKLLNQPVVRVERAPEGRYRVISRRAGEILVEEFDFVVAALPNNWLLAIDWSGLLLADAMRRHHAHYDYPAHYLRVSLLFERPFWREQLDQSYFMLDAFGGCCVYDESSRTYGVRYGALGWLLAGEAALTFSNFEDRELIDRVLDSLPAVLAPARELFIEGQVHRWVGTVNGRPGGWPVHAPEARHQPEPVEHPRLFVVGDYLFDSTLNGVLDSADWVVGTIAEEVAEAASALERAEVRVPK